MIGQSIPVGTPVLLVEVDEDGECTNRSVLTTFVARRGPLEVVVDVNGMPFFAQLQCTEDFWHIDHDPGYLTDLDILDQVEAHEGVKWVCTPMEMP